MTPSTAARRTPTPLARLLAITALASAAAALGGCALGQLAGGIAESARRHGSHDVEAKYDGLAGKSFAVVVAADRSIQADHPDLVPLVCREVTKALSERAGASGMVPVEDVLRFQYQRPGWVAMTPEDLAKALGVERFVFIELNEYAFTDPGNIYIWNGVAAGSVSVLEADAAFASDFSFHEPVRVAYPDEEGLSPQQIPEQTVRLELTRRFVRRASWMFFDHEEPNVIEY